MYTFKFNEQARGDYCRLSLESVIRNHVPSITVYYVLNIM